MSRRVGDLASFLVGLLTAAVLLGGCAALPFGPAYTYTVYGRQPIDPVPEGYRDVAHQVKACVTEALASGDPYGVGPFRDIPFDRVRWYRSPLIERSDGIRPGGISEADELWIIIQEDYLEDPRVIAHEWLHLEVYPFTHGQGVFYLCDPFRTLPDGG